MLSKYRWHDADFIFKHIRKVEKTHCNEDRHEDYKYGASYPFVVLMSSTNLQSPLGALHITMFHIQELCVLPKQHIHVFCIDLRTNINYFPVQH